MITSVSSVSKASRHNINKINQRTGIGNDYKSRIFPKQCVGESISCSKLWLSIKSQKAFEIELLAEIICQLISAKLKSPTTSYI